jgi:hypothetical protein
MKKSAFNIPKQFNYDLKWTDDKIYSEIRKILFTKYKNAKLENVLYNIHSSVNVNGSFTYQDQNNNTRHRVNYEVLTNKLRIDWDSLEVIQ